MGHEPDAALIIVPLQFRTFLELQTGASRKVRAVSEPRLQSVSMAQRNVAIRRFAALQSVRRRMPKAHENAQKYAYVS